MRTNHLVTEIPELELEVSEKCPFLRDLGLGLRVLCIRGLGKALA